MRFSWLLLLLLVGCIQEGSVPEPTDEIGKAVQASKQYHRLLGEQFIAAADRVESGELDSDRKANTFLKERNKAARDAAFAEINKILQARTGDGKWSKTEAASIYRKLGDTLQK